MLRREIEALAPEERQTMLELTNPWIGEGREIGREEGAVHQTQALLPRIGGKRLGAPSEDGPLTPLSDSHDYLNQCSA